MIIRETKRERAEMNLDAEPDLRINWKEFERIGWNNDDDETDSNTVSQSHHMIYYLKLYPNLLSTRFANVQISTGISRKGLFRFKVFKHGFTPYRKKKLHLASYGLSLQISA